MAAVAMVTILNASRARRGSIRSLADEDIPGVNDDDGDEHFVTDAIPESCIIHKRDVSKTAPCADLLPRMSQRVSYAQVQIASSGEPTMIEKICTIHQYRQSPATSYPCATAGARSRLRAGGPETGLSPARRSPLHTWTKPLSSRSRPRQGLGHRSRCKWGTGGCAHARARAPLAPYGARAPMRTCEPGWAFACAAGERRPPAAPSRMGSAEWARGNCLARSGAFVCADGRSVRHEAVGDHRVLCELPGERHGRLARDRGGGAEERVGRMPATRCNTCATRSNTAPPVATAR